MKLRQTVKRLARTGVEGSMPPRRARYVVMVNSVALLGLIVTLVYLPTFVFVAEPWLVIATALQLPIWAAPLWFNYRRAYSVAFAAQIAGAFSVFSSQVFIYGSAPGHHFYLLALATAPFLLAAPNQRWLMRIGAVGGGAGFLAFEVFGHHITPLAVLDGPPVLVRGPLMVGVLVGLTMVAHYSRRGTLAAEAAFQVEHDKAERLLLNVLPASIAARLKEDPTFIADGFEQVTVLFADIAGFTPMSAALSPSELVDLLNRIFSRFDRITLRLGLEKIKTIGDAYMVAAGLPRPRADHADAIAEMALEMRDALQEVQTPGGVKLAMRIGIHTGPVVAGVIGEKRFAYDLWGDTVNVASRMESHGVDGEIQLTPASRSALSDRFEVVERGQIRVKGKGDMTTYFLRGVRA